MSADAEASTSRLPKAVPRIEHLELKDNFERGIASCDRGIKKADELLKHMPEVSATEGQAKARTTVSICMKSVLKWKRVFEDVLVLEAGEKPPTDFEHMLEEAARSLTHLYEAIAIGKTYVKWAEGCGSASSSSKAGKRKF